MTVMYMMLLKRKFYLALLAAIPVVFAGSVTLKADDTDIYLNSAGSEVDAPMVMFMLDWRPNLTSTVCNKFAAGASTIDVATACEWDPDITAHFTVDDRSDGVIDRFELLRAVLKLTMTNLDGIKVGVMIGHNDSGCSNLPAGQTHSVTGCSTGGYIMQGFKLLEASDSNGNKAAFHNKLAQVPEVIAPGHVYQGKEIYFEFFRYLTGQGIYTGHMGWRDYGSSDSSVNLDADPTYSAIAWDTSIQGKVTGKDYYVSPFQDGASCTKVFAINFMFGVLNSQTEADAGIQAGIADGGMAFKLSGGQNSQFGAVVQKMNDLDHADKSTFSRTPTIDGKQNVTSYFVIESPSKTENEWAKLGGTNTAIAWSDDPSELVEKLKSIFSQILSVSTTFVSASVPVNVFNRAEFLDDVYIALFEAEENGYPHWIGNVKKLKLTPDDSGLFIGDAKGNPAFAGDGRLNYNALTFWTELDGYDMSDTNRYDPDIEDSSADGRSVNRGGAGQRIPDFLDGAVGTTNSVGPRKLYTEPASYTNGTPATMMNLDATTAVVQSVWDDLRAAGVYASGTTLNNSAWTANDYASATADEKAEGLDMLKWIRGIDVNDEDTDGSTTDTRPWLMADAIHSRPLTINYGATDGYSEDNPDVRIVVSTNEGLVHMLRNTTSGGAEDGGEAWSFMPRYAMRTLKRLKDNGAGSPIHPYGVDGAPAVYTEDVNGDGTIKYTDDDKAYLYFGMRRGGRNYYALDISNPDVPEMLWSISDNNADFAELGLTFSRPRIARLSYDSHVRKPVLIFGGGYDTNKDTRSDAPGTNDTRGRGIYIVDAETGALIWKAVYGTDSNSTTTYYRSDMLDSIPSDVAAIDTTGNGSVDRLYVGDTGGRIWRVDLAGTDRNNWKAQFFADLGRHVSGADKNDDRRFFHAVDVVQTRDSTGAFDAVIIGSGDRPNPLDKGFSSGNTPENWFYMMKDRKTVSGADLDYTIVPSLLADMSDNCAQYSVSNCTAGQQASLELHGWMFEMEQRAGEKVLSSPITINGVIFFTTYLPPDTSSSSGLCEPSEGDGSVYAVDLYTAAAVFDWDLTNTTYDANGEELTLHKTDRYRKAGHGIPSDPIAITKNGEMHIITPGDNYTTTMDMASGYKTFWYVEGE